MPDSLSISMSHLSTSELNSGYAQLGDFHPVTPKVIASLKACLFLHLSQMAVM